jgi:UDP-glucose 4-epimerase
MAGRGTVLVVGGAGYIGSHTVKQLAHAGYKTVALDNLVYGHRDAVVAGVLEEGDASDLDFLRDVFARHPIDAVMHFGAFTYVGESVTDPAKYYENNVVATLRLLHAMREAQVDKLVFSSTCAIYGEPERLPLTEDHPTRPLSPYGRTKWMIEQILQDYDRAYGLRSISFRYFGTIRRATSSRWCSRRSGLEIPSPCSETTTRRPMAPASVTTFTSSISPARTSSDWSSSSQDADRAPTTWAMDRVTPCVRS